MAVMLECCGRLSGFRGAFTKCFRVVLSQCVGCEGVLGHSALSQVSVIFWSVDVALVLSVGFYGPLGENVESDPLICHKRAIFQFLYVLYVSCICISMTVPYIDPADSHASISPINILRGWPTCI